MDGVVFLTKWVQTSYSHLQVYIVGELLCSYHHIKFTVTTWLHFWLHVKTLDPLKLLKFVLIFDVKNCAGKQDVTYVVSLNFYVMCFFTVQYLMLNTDSISQILLRLGIL